MSTTQPRRRLFLKPRLWHIAIVLILFLLQAITGGALVGELYAQGDLVSGALLGLLVGAAFVGLIALTGWLPRIMRERHRHPRLWPALLVGGALLASFIASLVTAEWSGVAGSFILGAAIVALADGLTEEVTFRGAVVVAARSRLREVWVWMLSTVLFASTHFLGLTAGQSLSDTLLQVLFTFVAGSSFYVLRRATGTLLLPILFHACNNFLVDIPNTVDPWWQLVAVSSGLIALVPVIRSADRQRKTETLDGQEPLA